MTTPDLTQMSEDLEAELSSMYDQYFGDTGEETDNDDTDTGTGETPASEEADTTSHPDTDADTGEADSEDEAGGADASTAPTVEDTTDDSDEGDAADPDGPQLYTVKVNGTEHQVELDELVRGYQTMRAANEKFEAAAGKEKELGEYVEFAKGFAEAIQTDPAALFAEYIEVVPDPNAVIVKMVERAAVAGKLHPELAQASGTTEIDTLRARADYERGRAERLQQAQQQTTAEQSDEFGYKPSEYSSIIDEIVSAAGMTSADFETQRRFVTELAAFRAEKKIANPYLAYAEWQRTRAAAEAAATATAAATAVKQAAKPKRIPAASSSSGQVPPPAPATPGPIHDHYEAASRAVALVFGE